MAKSPTGVSQCLAYNLITLRKQRAMSQAQLAKLARVPRSTITYLESGQGNPSLENLIRIASALQISLDELLSHPRPEVKLIPMQEQPSEKRGQGMVTLFKLLPDSIPGMEFNRMILELGSRMGGVPHLANTKEYLVCMKGAVQLAVGGQKYTLNQGDVIAFPGDQHHSYINIWTHVSECISVVVLAPKHIT